MRITVLDVNAFSVENGMVQPWRKRVIHHGRNIPSCT